MERRRKKESGSGTQFRALHSISNAEPREHPPLSSPWGHVCILDPVTLKKEEEKEGAAATKT